MPSSSPNQKYFILAGIVLLLLIVFFTSFNTSNSSTKNDSVKTKAETDENKEQVEKSLKAENEATFTSSPPLPPQDSYLRNRKTSLKRHYQQEDSIKNDYDNDDQSNNVKLFTPPPLNVKVINEIERKLIEYQNKRDDNEIPDDDFKSKYFYADAEIFSDFELNLMNNEQPGQLNPKVVVNEKIVREQFQIVRSKLEAASASTSSVGVSSKQHSIIVLIPSIDKATEGAKRLSQLMNCNRDFSKGKYWNVSTNRCELLDGWGNGVGKSFRGEDSNNDDNNNNAELVLSMDEPQLAKKRNELVCPSSLLKKKLAGNNMMMMNSNLPKNLLARYQKFKSTSYWLFASSEAEKDWFPQVDDNINNVTSSSKSLFRSFHDPRKENLFHLENFCISPYSNLKGYFGGNTTNKDNNNNHKSGGREDPLRPNKVYQGQDDTRNMFHGDFQFARYLSNVEQKKDPPLFFDKRTVYFVPLTKISLNNLGHLSLKILSAIGNLNVISTSSSSRNSRGGQQQHQQQESTKNSDELQKPLVIFVLDKSIRSLAELEKLRPAWKMMFQILDLPWQIISNYDEFEIDGKKQYVSNAELCFRTGYAYQNDFASGDNTAVAAISSSAENDRQQSRKVVPSYAFRIFDRITPQRRKLMDAQLKLFNKCMMDDDKKKRRIQIASSTSTTPPQLPKIVFALRTSSRGILKLSTMIDQIRNELTQEGENRVAREVVFLEPWKTDRVEYLRHIQDSDIHFGTHGATFAETWIMRKNTSMLIELSERYYEQYCLKNFGKKISCWFGLFSEYLNGDHWVLQVPNKKSGDAAANMRWDGKNTFNLNLPSIVGLLKKATCRWQYKKFLLSEQQEREEEQQPHQRDTSSHENMMEKFFSLAPENIQNVCGKSARFLMKKSRHVGMLPVESSAALNNNNNKNLQSQKQQQSKKSSITSTKSFGTKSERQQSSSLISTASYGGSLSVRNALANFISEFSFQAIGNKLSSTGANGVDLRQIFDDPNPEVVKMIQDNLNIRLESTNAEIWQPFVDFFVSQHVEVKERVINNNKKSSGSSKAKRLVKGEVSWTVACLREKSNTEKDECLYLVGASMSE